MELTDIDQRLLVLHYVYPVPFNKIAEILKIDPDLRDLYTYRPNDLVRLLQIPESKAVRLSEQLKRHEQTPFTLLYHREKIIPIPITNPAYPKKLKWLVDPPTVLYVKGDPTILEASLKVADHRLQKSN